MQVWGVIGPSSQRVDAVVRRESLRQRTGGDGRWKVAVFAGRPGSPPHRHAGTRLCAERRFGFPAVGVEVVVPWCVPGAPRRRSGPVRTR